MSRLEDLTRRMRARYDVENPEDRDHSVKALTVLAHRLIELVQPAETVEVGAHEASFSRRCAEALPRARVLAVEANPHVWARYWWELRDECPRIRYEWWAAWDGLEIIEMRLRPTLGWRVDRLRGDHSLLARTDFELPPGAHEEVIEVPAMTLDWLMPKREMGNGPVAMWIDVEGATARVIQGAHRVLNRTALVVVELEREPVWEGQEIDEQIDARLEAYGLVPVFEDVAAPGQRNVLYVQRGLLNPSGLVAMLVEEALTRPADA